MTSPIPTDPDESDHYRPVGTLSWELRWFLGAVVVVPTLLAVGVYWLHQVPPGLDARASDTIVQVHLVKPLPDAKVKTERAVVQPNPPIANFDTDVSVQAQHFPDDPALSRPEPAPPQSPPPSRKAVSNVGGAPAVPNSVVLRFQRTLQAHVEHYRSYPATARRDRLQGTVQVLFAMRRDGTVLDAWVQASSGQMLLDKEALETIRRAQPLPAIPPELPGQLNILLPVSFDLP